MVHEFRLPDVGEGVSEGELVNWLVEAGETVSEDQPLAEVETDKALVDIPAPVSGTVEELLYEPGDVIPVGEVFITIATEESPAEPEMTEAETESGTDDDTTGPTVAPPSVRRLARELKVDLEAVEGTGPSGRITEADVRAVAEGAGEDSPAEPTEASQSAPEQPTEPAEPTGASAAADRDRTLAVPATRRIAREEGVDLDAIPASDTVEGEAFVSMEDIQAYAERQVAAQAADGEAVQRSPAGDREERIAYRGVRRTIGEQMEESKYSAPHVTHHELIAVPNLVETRERLKPVAADRGVNLTYLPFVIKALIAALREHPYLNAELDEENEEIILKEYYNIGVAVATDAGLMVPVVNHADEKGLVDLAAETRELAQQARDREIAMEDLRGSTVSITNFGAIGGDYATPILNYPEVAIVGLGELKQRPVVEEGEVVAEYTLPLSITIDHRIVDGAQVAAFAKTLGEYLQDPELLLLE